MEAGQQTRRCSGGGNRGGCQGPEERVIAKAPQNLAASSHVKAPVGGGKSSGLQDGQEVPEKWPCGSNIGRKIKSFFAAGLDEEGVEHHSTNPTSIA